MDKHIRLITFDTAVQIYKTIISRAEEFITEEFLKQFPDALFPICTTSDGFNTRNQIVITKGYNNKEKVQFTEEKKHEVRVATIFKYEENKLIFKSRDRSIKFGYEEEYKLTNPLFIDIIRKCWEQSPDNKYYYTSKHLRSKLQYQEGTFVETKSINDGFSEILNHMLNIDFDYEDIIFSISGSGGWSYKENEDKSKQWNRIYGGSIIPITENSLKKEVGIIKQ